MPTFCRHNRFIERCPICSKTLPGHAAETTPRRAASTRAAAGERQARRRAPGGESVRVRREGRAEQDGYSSELIPGVHASADARRLAEELAFSSARLHALSEKPPGLYAEISGLAAHDLERATWIVLLIAYLSPLQDADDPFAGIRLALSRGPGAEHLGGELPDLSGVPLGPRSSHDPARGSETLLAYRQWVQRTAGEGGQAQALTGDPGWSPERRFERLFERLALPGFGRPGRYELLILLGRLGLYELKPDSLHLSGATALSSGDGTVPAAKRVFAIGDPLLLERRASALADAVGAPVETLDLALANWAAPQRATLGFPAEISDAGVLERAGRALRL